MHVQLITASVGDTVTRVASVNLTSEFSYAISRRRRDALSRIADPAASAIASKRCQPNQFSPEAQTAQVRAAIAAEAIIDELAILLAGLKRLGKATHGPGATDTTPRPPGNGYQIGPLTAIAEKIQLVALPPALG